MSSISTFSSFRFLPFFIALLGWHPFAGAATYESADLGSVDVGSTSSAQVLSFSFTGLTAQPIISLRFGNDFAAANTTCDSGWNTCSVTVTFTPTLSGSRRDALIAKDASGNVLSTTYLYGVGLGPQIRLGHGTITSLATTASNQYISSIRADPGGNLFYVESASSAVIRKLTPGSSTPQTVVGGSSYAGPFVENTPGTNFYLTSGVQLTTDAAGNVFFAPSYGGRIYKWDGITGKVTTVAGGGTNTLHFQDGDSATSIFYVSAYSLATDLLGNLYFSNGVEIDRIDLATGKVYRFAGTGSYGNLEDTGPAVNVAINVNAMTVDSKNNLLILGSGVIRKVDALTKNISTLYGKSSGTTIGDGVFAPDANLGFFYNLTSDPQDNLYLGPNSDGNIWKIDAASHFITKLLGQFSGPKAGPGIDSESAVFGFSPVLIDGAGNIVTTSSTGIIQVSSTSGLVLFQNPLPGNTASPQLITISNNGNRDLSLQSQSISGPYQLSSASNGPCAFPGTLAAGTRCTVIISPTSSGSLANGSLTLTDNSLNVAGGSQVISLQTGYPVAQPQSATYSFGRGTAVNDTQYGYITFANTGGQTNLYVTSAVLSGDNTADFRLSDTSCGPVYPGSSCSLGVMFMPKFVGTRTATLTVTTNAMTSTQTVTLTGIGLPRPVLSVSPASLTFPNQLVGTSSAPQTITVTNTGTPDIQLSSFSYLSSSFFISTDTCALTSYLLRAGQSCSYSIQFKPTSAQQNTSSFSISGTGSGIYLYNNVALSGTGIAKTNTRFIPVVPCRVADTRDPAGAFGGPALAGQSSRDLEVSSSNCGVPSNAAAYSINVTVVPKGPLSWVTVWPAGQVKPTVSTLNSFDGRVKANAAIIPAGIRGAISLFATDTTEVIIDINGYFVSVTDNSGLSFYPMSPCRVTDTRETDPLLGGPYLAGNSQRRISVLSSRCSIPANAQAYSMNLTAIPRSPLGYLTVWPSGQARPLVSTLNATTGTVVANAAIVPAGQNGDINVYATDDSDLVIDINGYFAPAAANGLSLYTLTPCRVWDTREAGSKEPLNGTLDIPLAGSCGLPSDMKAVISNATVVPVSPLQYLTLWPANQTQPVVSTLNAFDSSVTSNMAIVPGPTGAAKAFTQGSSHFILDVSAYFAP